MRMVFQTTGTSTSRLAELSMPTREAAAAALSRTVDEVRRAGRGKDYDCVLGLSGGVDSSYLAHLTVELGLRPLVVHFDNGWNSELAVGNIENLVKGLHLDLHTFVMDWPEFRDLQRSYFKASVVDLEVPTDHMILGALYKVAQQHGLKFLLSGTNVVTEAILPRRWYFSKFASRIFETSTSTTVRCHCANYLRSDSGR